MVPRSDPEWFPEELHSSSQKRVRVVPRRWFPEVIQSGSQKSFIVVPRRVPGWFPEVIQSGSKKSFIVVPRRESEWFPEELHSGSQKNVRMVPRRLESPLQLQPLATLYSLFLYNDSASYSVCLILCIWFIIV